MEIITKGKLKNCKDCKKLSRDPHVRIVPRRELRGKVKPSAMEYFVIVAKGSRVLNIRQAKGGKHLALIVSQQLSRARNASLSKIKAPTHTETPREERMRIKALMDQAHREEAFARRLLGH